MIHHHVKFLFARKPDGKVVVASTSIVNNSLEITDEEKIEFIISEGFDFIRLVEPDENIIGLDFRYKDDDY